MGSGRTARWWRWLLPLAVPACCVLWMILAFAPPPPPPPPALDVGRRESFHASVAEITGATGRRAAATPPVHGNEEVGRASRPPPSERHETIRSSPPALDAGRREIFHVSAGEIAGAPPVTGREDIVHASPPPPERQEIIDTPPPPPPERRAKREETSPPPSPPERELIVVASPPPPKLEEITVTSPPPSQPAARHSHERPSSAGNQAAVAGDRCAGRYIYVHDLPSRFNADLLRDCRSLSDWTDMCKHVTNSGMGPRLTRTGGVLPPTGWYDTNQFTLEVIFHARMRQYACLTADSTRAAAVYVPYYAGLDVGRHLWGHSNGVRDALAEDLVDWLRSTPAWKARGGTDHFLVAGRIAWDFRRQRGGDWGSRLLLLPEVSNMTALVLESSSGSGPWHWHAAGGADVAVPYPTYFHPSRAAEVASWQRTLRRSRRPWLFAFAGGARRAVGGGTTLRDAVIDQCARSRRCGLLQCGARRRRGRSDDCYSPGAVVRHLRSAAFCLQPPGDSYTRRSAFDAVLAGCVPVFFHPGSAYTQYRWHLPRDHAAYSVFVPGDGVRNGTVRVEDVLRRIGRKEVAAMRERVIRMIPGIVYRDPRSPAAGFRDAFDVAVDGVIERVGRIKRGLSPWKDDGNQRRWDGYFDSR
ncbi:unnamed protein product [Urochloa decumbens]|uniref:Exostosin GT47 domain-containing protein n=1 Tax=Urochloa decumbens TaxID=240449 RepID=A0ABC8VXD4_9POAL